MSENFIWTEYNSVYIYTNIDIRGVEIHSTTDWNNVSTKLEVPIFKINNQTVDNEKIVYLSQVGKINLVENKKIKKLITFGDNININKYKIFDLDGNDVTEKFNINKEFVYGEKPKSVLNTMITGLGLSILISLYIALLLTLNKDEISTENTFYFLCVILFVINLKISSRINNKNTIYIKILNSIFIILIIAMVYFVLFDKLAPLLKKLKDLI